MSLAAGKLRHKLALQSRTSIQDATTGETVQLWATVAEVFGAIEPLSAREFIQSGTTQVQVVARITIRARSDINNTWRVVHLRTGKVYEVEGVLADKDSGVEYQTLPVSAGASVATDSLTGIDGGSASYSGLGGISGGGA